MKMAKLSMCRMCLVQDVNMYVVTNKNLQEIYEKLTDIRFCTEDRRPTLVCFFCCTKLQQCCRLQRNCLEAEKLFAQMLNKDYKTKPLLSRGQLEFSRYIISPTQNFSIPVECQSDGVIIKEELPDVCEGSDDENQAELGNEVRHMENVNVQSYLEIKIETVEEEEEVPKTKRKANNTICDMFGEEGHSTKRSLYSGNLSSSHYEVMQSDRVNEDVEHPEACTAQRVDQGRHPDYDNYDWQPSQSSRDLDMSVSEIFAGSLGKELRLDASSEGEEEPILLEERRAIQAETAEESVKDDTEEYERLSESFNWSSDYSTFKGQPENYSQPNKSGPNIEGTDPLELFTHVWDHDIMNSIVADTNQYAWQTLMRASGSSDGITSHSRLNGWVATSMDELYMLFGVMIFMSLTVRVRVTEYWSTGILGMPDFRSLMSQKRYWLLMRFLHFVDNNTISIRDSGREVVEIQPIIDHCNRKFNSMYTPRREISIDESLQGRLSWIQCIRSKAAGFGIKFYELCEAITGYLLKFEVITDKRSPHGGDSAENSLYGFTGANAKVVLRLMQGFLHKGHCLVMENYYNSITLTRFLKSNKTDVIGTLNRRKIGTPRDIQTIDEKSLQKGAVVARHCDDVSVLSWKDVNLVTTVSTYHSADMMPGKRAGQQIQKPAVVHDYNKYMGGLDLKDQKLSMYLMERDRGIKWYMKVFERLLNISILNTHIIHCQNSRNPLSQRQFRYKLAEQLVQRYPKCIIPRVINPTAILRLNGNNHFPMYANSIENRAGNNRNKILRKRCVRCSVKKIRKEVNTMCQTCQMFLCLGQCWIDYHTVENL